jgi:Double zinc ribbon
MALIACSECGAQISDKAPACVKCGCPVTRSLAEPGAPAEPEEPKGTVTCISCGAEVDKIAIVCPRCGEPPVRRIIAGINDRSPEVSAPGGAPDRPVAGTVVGGTRPVKKVDLPIGTQLGFLVGYGIALLLCLTIIGAVIGGPLMIGLFLQDRKLRRSGISGSCPYCASELAAPSLLAGVKCGACKKQVVIRDQRFIAVP